MTLSSGLRRASVAVLALLACAAAPASAQGPSGGDIVGYRDIHHPVIGRGGMVVGQSGIAAQVGVAILRRGGNAVDAAVATAFAEAVALPRAGNLGGGGYMLVHMAQGARTIAIGYYGEAPHATTPGLLLNDQGRFDRRKAQSFKGVAIPGTVAGLWAAHSRFGRLPWREVVAPATALARDGVILSDDEAHSLQVEGGALARDPAAHAAFFKPDGSPYAPGERWRQPDLAATLEKIASGGADAFYRGEVARELVAGVQAAGGVISAADLADYRPQVEAPVWSDYRGLRIAYMPPTSSGVSVAEVMNILERFPLRDLGWGTAASLHVFAEAMKLAWADRAALGGPGMTPARLVDKGYAAGRAALIKPGASLTAKDLGQAEAAPESPNTTHFSVADAEGNVVSNTFTLSSSFGAGVMAPGTGFLLNNSMGNLAWGARGASEPGNRPAPGKRVDSTITPLIVFRAGKPWLVSGTPGGGYIIAVMAQLLSNVIDHGLNVEEATERARVNQSGVGGALELEEGVSQELVAPLVAKGHKVVRSNTMGSTQSIELEGDLFLGASDTRRPGATALGVR